MRVELANGAAQTNPGTARQPVVQEVKVEVALPSKAQPIVEVRAKVSLYSARVSSTISQASSWSSTKRIRFFCLWKLTILLSAPVLAYFLQFSTSTRSQGNQRDNREKDQAVLWQYRAAYHFKIAARLEMVVL